MDETHFLSGVGSRGLSEEEVVKYRPSPSGLPLGIHARGLNQVSRTSWTLEFGKFSATPLLQERVWPTASLVWVALRSISIA